MPVHGLSSWPVHAARQTGRRGRGLGASPEVRRAGRAAACSPSAAEHGVDAGGVELQPLHKKLLDLHTSGSAGPLAQPLEHLRRGIGEHDAAGLPHLRGGDEAGVAEAARELEDALAGLELSEVDQARGHRGGGAIERELLAGPSVRGAVPALIRRARSSCGGMATRPQPQAQAVGDLPDGCGAVHRVEVQAGNADLEERGGELDRDVDPERTRRLGVAIDGGHACVELRRDRGAVHRGHAARAGHAHERHDARDQRRGAAEGGEFVAQVDVVLHVEEELRHAEVGELELGGELLAVFLPRGRARVHLRERGDADGEVADAANQLDELGGVDEVAVVGAVGRRVASERGMFSTPASR